MATWTQPKLDWNASQQGVTDIDLNRIEENIEFLGEGGTIQDTEGNTYPTVVINARQWTAANWRSTEYSDGTAIPLVEDQTAWDALATPAYCAYNNEVTVHGLLYNNYTVRGVNPKTLAPDGWRVASAADMSSLTGFLRLNGYSPDQDTSSGAQLGKSLASSEGWDDDSLAAGGVGYKQYMNNNSGVAIPPSGIRTTVFELITSFGAVWASDLDYTLNPYYLSIIRNSSQYTYGTDFPATYGLGVRMVRDV